jgi:predicted metal-dependent HD superfamily phosphohydrolase
MPNNNELRWGGFWRRLGAAGDPFPVYSALIAHYAEKHRAYHTLAHIEHCLQELEPVRSMCADVNAVEMALWFHDAIYNPQAKDNEAKSADLATEAAQHAGLAESFIARVTEMILATRHQAVPIDGDSQIVVDIDLAILGKSPERFDAYEKQIRREYKWVPKILYNKGRGDILKSFLQRPKIYSTEYFYDLYESQARENIRCSLKQL